MIASPPTSPAARPGAYLRIAWWSERRCVDRWAHVVRPDSYGRWQEHGRQGDFFLEYDRGTELLDQLGAYWELADATQMPIPVLLWLPSSCRGANLREALVGDARWARVPFVATTSPALVLGPAEAAWLPLGQTWPRRRLIDLADVDHNTDATSPSPARS